MKSNDLSTMICHELPWWGHAAVWIAVFGWEFYLGETKFGSTVRMIGMVFRPMIISVLEALKRKSNDR
jgi:hypothetical protein